MMTLHGWETSMRKAYQQPISCYQQPISCYQPPSLPYAPAAEPQQLGQALQPPERLQGSPPVSAPSTQPVIQAWHACLGPSASDVHVYVRQAYCGWGEALSGIASRSFLAVMGNTVTPFDPYPLRQRSGHWFSCRRLTIFCPGCSGHGQGSPRPITPPRAQPTLPAAGKAGGARRGLPDGAFRGPRSSCNRRTGIRTPKPQCDSAATLRHTHRSCS